MGNPCCNSANGDAPATRPSLIKKRSKPVARMEPDHRTTEHREYIAIHARPISFTLAITLCDCRWSGGMNDFDAARTCRTTRLP